jgi:hypothetical protein
MHIFILNTGRCGSTTCARACQHMTNYTAAHESGGLRDNLTLSGLWDNLLPFPNPPPSSSASLLWA